MKLLTTSIGRAVRTQLAGASRARIATAYFNPDEEDVTALCAVPRVSVLTGNDFLISDPYKLERLADRHEVLQMPPDLSSGKLHAKVFLFDRHDGSQFAIVGSANFTHGGLETNREVAVLLESSSEADRSVLHQLHQWFDSTKRDATALPFTVAKQIYDRSSRREAAPARSMMTHVKAWVLKTHPGSDRVDYWLRFLAEGVVSIGWEDVNVNPSDVTDDELEDALRRAYPYDPGRKRERNYAYVVKQIRQFESWQEGDVILLCRGYPGNGNSPVHVYGFATVCGPFFDDMTSDWWRFKHRALIQVVDGKIGREQIASALGMGSLRNTIHSASLEALRHVAELCSGSLDSPVTV